MFVFEQRLAGSFRIWIGDALDGNCGEDDDRLRENMRCLFHKGEDRKTLGSNRRETASSPGQDLHVIIYVSVMCLFI